MKLQDRPFAVQQNVHSYPTQPQQKSQIQQDHFEPFSPNSLRTNVFSPLSSNLQDTKQEKQFSCPEQSAFSIPQELLPQRSGRINKCENSYLAPNEYFPQKAEILLRKFQKTPADIYLSVGTERGLIGAYMSNAKTLICLDLDPAVHRFHLINTELLRTSNNRDDYVQLRNNPKLWKKRFKADPPVFKEILDPNNLEFWESNIAYKSKNFLDIFVHPDKKEWKAFVNRPKQNANKKINKYKHIPFEDRNYLFDDQSFKFAKNLAETGNILVLNANLTSNSSMQHLKGMLKQQNRAISVFDVSNSWWPEYTGYSRKPFGNTIDILKEVCSQDSLLLLTDRGPTKLKLPEELYKSWQFSTFKIKDIHPNQSQRFLVDLRNKIRKSKTSLKKYGLEVDFGQMLDPLVEKQDLIH